MLFIIPCFYGRAQLKLLSNEEQKWLEKNSEQISFAPNPSWPPMDFIDENGNHRGIVADYVEYIEKSLALNFKTKKYNNWAQIIDALKAKKVDVIGAIQQTTERNSYLNFTDVYFKVPLFILVNNDYQDKIEEEDLESMDLAVVKAYASTDYIRKVYPKINIYEFDDDLTALLQTSFGKTDGTLIDLATASYLVEKYGISNLSLGMKVDFDWEIRFASIKNKSPLHSILNKVLKNMSKSDKKAIHDKWIKIDLITGKNFWERNYKILMLISAILLIPAIIIAYYNRLLKTRIHLRTHKLKDEVRKKNEALMKVKESEENYRSLFYNSALPKWIYEMDSLNIMEVNEAAIKHYGYSREEFLSMSIKDIRPAEDIPKLLDKSRKAKVEGLSSYYGVWNHLLKSGEVIQVEVYGHIIIYKGKKCKTVTCKDITQQLESEKMMIDFAENLERKVEIRTEELFSAHSLLIEQHQEITDSINYAKRIQLAIFPKQEEVLEIFPKSFLFFKPKEVVSGDFYWCYHKENFRFIAVADCTGHGVPGALLSMIGHQLLNQIVLIKKIYSPSEILKELDREILDLLNQSDKKNGANDGMDMVICMIDDSSKKLSFAAARNPLFFVQDGVLKEVTGSKRSIGGDPHHNFENNYEEIHLDYKQGDRIYLSSDGFFDQFGGHKNKKITKKSFRQLLIDNQNLSMQDQYSEISGYFFEWMKKQEQIDDVLVMGIEL